MKLPQPWHVSHSLRHSLRSSQYPPIPLHRVLIVLFVGLIIVTVGAVEYLWIRNGQRAVQDLTNQLMDKVGNQVRSFLSIYLYTPQLVNQLNANTVTLNGLDLQNLPAVEQYLFTQLMQFDSISSIQVGNAQNDFRLVTRQNNLLTGQNNLRLIQANAANPTQIEEYALDSQGRKTQRLKTTQQTRVRDQLWYQTALFASKPTWGTISQLSNGDDLFLTATSPVYGAQNQVDGVFSSAVSLDAINQFLSNLQVGKSGQVFIIERDGWTVATSTPPGTNNDAQFQRSNLIDSRDPVARAAARSLIVDFGDFSRIKSPQQFVFSQAHHQHFLQVVPFTDQYGLDWLIVITIPKADFMERIYASTRTTILLSTGAFLGAIALGLWSARWLTRPIRQLSQSSQALARGSWEQITTNDSPIAELQVLNQSFNWMSQQLQQSFNRVTTALQESEERFTKIFHTSPDPISITVISTDCYLEVNDCFLEITGYSRPEVIGHTIAELNLIADPEQLQRVQQLLKMQQAVQNLELDIRTKSGETKIVLLSSERIELDGQPCILSVFRDFTDRKQLELALQRSEAKLSDVLNGVVASIASVRILSDGTWHYEYWSEGCEAVFGYTAQEFLANQNLWQSRVFPDDLAQATARNARHHPVKKTFSVEYRFYHKNGSLRWISGHLISQQTATNDWLITTVEVDITDRKQIEEALRQNEATKNQILKAIPDLIIWMTANGTCIDLIEGSNTTSLVPAPELIGKNLFDYMPADLAQQRMDVIQQALRTGELQVYEQKLVVQGKLCYEEVRVVGIDIDRVLTIIRNVTERKQTEANLRESEERFRSAFASTAIGMALVSLNNCWLKVNPVLSGILGYSETELLSMSVTALVYPEDTDRFWFCTKQMLSAENHRAQAKLRFCCNNSRIAWGLLDLSLVRDSHNQPLYYVAQIQDVTEQMAVERMKNEFISIVSHELRTPLTAIRGFLGLLNTGIYDQRPDKVKHMIRQALTNSDRLVRLVNDILDLERLDSGKVQLTLETCEAERLMQSAVEGLQSIAEQATVTLTIISTTAQVQADSDTIIQTLTNLLSNAIKFSPPNSTVTLAAQPQAGQVLFSVSDQGRGIPPDKLETIFGRFQQVDISDARRKGGTGLGLAICQSIVQQHGGSIWVESKLGVGSTFYFTLLTPPELKLARS